MPRYLVVAIVGRGTGILKKIKPHVGKASLVADWNKPANPLKAQPAIDRSAV
jgi:hypothetical protein